jgi:hypothetical protein
MADEQANNLLQFNETIDFNFYRDISKWVRPIYFWWCYRNWESFFVLGLKKR